MSDVDDETRIGGRAALAPETRIEGSSEAKETEGGEDDSRASGPLPLLSVAVAMMAVSFSAILIKWSNAHPLAIAFYRMLLTLVLLSPFAVTSLRKDLSRRSLERREMGQLLGIGVILAVHFATWVTSLTLTSVASSVLLVTMHPVFVGVVGYYLLDEGLGKINVLGICVALSGTLVLVYGDFSPGEGSLLSQEAILGDLLAFVGGIAAGTYILAGRYFRRSLSLITYVFVVYSGCTLSLLVMCIVAAVPFTYPPREYILFLIMAFGPGILGHTLYNWALKYVKATVVSVSLLGEPVGSSLLAFILLNEVPSSLTVAGGVAILIGIYLTAKGLNRD